MSVDRRLIVWIFQTGEPLPGDDGNPRPMRAMNLADTLVKRGHSVVLWSSAFFHQEKRHRCSEPRSIAINPQLEVRLIPSMGYDRNIGPGRLTDHAQLALNLHRLLRAEKSRPDAAFIGYPPIEFAAVAAGWAKRHGIPSMLDGKDQWPEIFVEPFPSLLKPLVRLALLPYFLLGKKAMRDATALSSMTESFLAWMQAFSGRTRHALDGVFPLSPMSDSISPEQLTTAEDWWAEREVRNDGRKRFFFVGSFSQAFDFESVKTAATIARERGDTWQFVICGDGGMASEVRALFSGLDNVILPGWIDRPKVVALSRLSTAGLAPYRNLPDFQKSVPNKIIDYLAMGQPLITPLAGEVQAVVNQFDVGLIYREADPESLVECLAKVGKDAGLRDRLSKNAIALYQKKYSGEKVYANLAARLEQLAARQIRPANA
jgi:glycosyltransferase involved in cell wall biosynthesis